MADVTPPDRGQILLVSALVIAAVFVALALVVNSGIYTENLATRETSSESSEVALNQQLVALDLQELIDRSNAAVAADDYTAVKNNYDGDLEAWASSQERRYSKTGRYVEYDQLTTQEGTRILQTNESRNFTAGDGMTGDADWTLVNETTETGRFEMVIQRPSLLDATGHTLDNVIGEAYHIHVENDTGAVWEIYFFRSLSPDTGYLLVEPPGGFTIDLTETLADLSDSDFCTSDDGDISLDVLNESFGGSHCSQLDFYRDHVNGAKHNITYQQTETDGDLIGLSLTEPEPRVRGTYDLIVNTRADRAPYWDPTTSNDPTANAIIYEASVRMTFQSDQVVYRNDAIEAKWSLVA